MAVERVEAIKTTYKGIEYRSRTEARWAVFLMVLECNLNTRKNI